MWVEGEGVTDEVRGMNERNEVEMGEEGERKMSGGQWVYCLSIIVWIGKRTHTRVEQQNDNAASNNLFIHQLYYDRSTTVHICLLQPTVMSLPHACIHIWSMDEDQILRTTDKCSPITRYPSVVVFFYLTSTGILLQRNEIWEMPDRKTKSFF